MATRKKDGKAKRIQPTSYLWLSGSWKEAPGEALSLQYELHTAVSENLPCLPFSFPYLPSFLHSLLSTLHHNVVAMAPRGFTLLTILPYLLYSLLFSIHNNALFANAQPSYIPESTRASVSAFIDGKAMYVHGGYTNDNQTTDQCFSLDLSTSWDVATPAYRSLPRGVKAGLNPGTLLNDSTTLFVMTESGYNYYNVFNGQLTGYATNLNNGYNLSAANRPAVTNPRTGRVYIPGGYYGRTDTAFSLLRFDPDTKKFDYILMPAALQPMYEYSAAWSDYLDAMLLFGGFDYFSKQASSSLYRYNYGDGSW